MKTLDLIDWTIQQADHFNTDQRESGEVANKTSLDNLFAVLGRELVGPASPEGAVARIDGIQIAAEGLTGQPFPDAADGPPETDVISNSPVLTQAAPATSANVGVEARKLELLRVVSNLHKATVKRDIFAAKEDRDRAFALRWVLRDIKSNRLKWSPINQQDLRILVIMGLVEMQNDAPVLTNAGHSAIV
jgi:hypothetical protein